MLIAGAFVPAPALAATVTVNTTADNAPTNDECQGVAGDCSLRQAIDKASSGATINFASSLAGKTITLTKGVLAISKSLKIAGPGAKKLAVSGNDASQIFRLYGTVSISGLTLTKGSAVSSPYQQGGAIEESGGSLILSHDSIINSEDLSTTVGAGGGAVEASLGPTDKLTITHSTVSGNKAFNGAGVLEYGSGKVIISASKFTQNKGFTANPGSGGAVFVQGSTKISKTVFSGNSAATGGALYLVADTTIVASTFSGNEATTTTSFDPSGGAIFVQSGQVNITNSTLTKNSAKPATGATGYGGGIFRCCGAPPINVVSDTIDANSAFGKGSTGGDVNSDNGQPAVRALDTIIADGVAATTGYTNCGEFEISLGYNLSSGICGFIKKGDRIDTEPKLSALAHNGGPTETMAEKSTSPAIDHGSPKAKCPSTDQRGKKRPDHHESRCDIGAYEHQDK